MHRHATHLAENPGRGLANMILKALGSHEGKRLCRILREDSDALFLSLYRLFSRRINSISPLKPWSSTS